MSKLYTYDGASWVEIVGSAGTNGTNGIDGKTILNGAVDPTTEGVDGDFYINTTSDEIFGPKTAGVWGTGTSIVGPAGTNGTNGAGVVVGGTTGQVLAKIDATDYNTQWVNQSGGIADPGSNGILARTALNTTSARTITGTANQVTVTNGDGVSGNPTLSLPQNIDTSATPTFSSLTAGTATDVLGTALSVIRNNVAVGRIDNNASGLRVQAQNGSLQLRGTGNTGIAIDASGNAVVAGTITGANLSGTNTGDQPLGSRTITGTTNQVTVTNGDGVSGNPTLSLPSAITTPGSLTITGNNSPQADSTYTLGTSSLYWSNTYTDRLYLNSTAYLDGGTAGAIGITGLVGIGTTSPGAKLQVDTGAAGTIGQIIEGAASQTADLLQLQNSSGTVLSKFTSAGNLLLPGGSSGAPSLSFTSDPNSGFYSLATNYFGVSAGGSLVATYQNNSGRKGTLLYGNTYSGTVANAVLTLSTDSSILATHSIDQTNKKYLIQPYESGVSYNVDTILNSLGGNVGIGTTSPSEKLEISGTVKATGYKSSDGSAGVSGSFTTTDGKTITIKDGLVVSIV